ncbi:hypothetical protein ACTFIZ_012311 [Dictyostelium cf. discoideum]
MKYLLVYLHILLFFLLKINSKEYCTYSGVGKDYNINFDFEQVIYGVAFRHSYLTVIFTTCNNTMACGRQNSSDIVLCGSYRLLSPPKNILLGVVEGSTYNFSKDGLMITYISEDTTDDDNCKRYTTNQIFQCDPNGNMSDPMGLSVNTELSGTCTIEFTLSSHSVCQTCPDCSKTHRISCDENSGWCTCDSYTKGLNCDQLNANIASVLTPTISGGDVTMSGDFSNIYNIRSSITISIGTSICNDIIFSSNKSQIICTMGAGKGNQQIKLSDGNGATLIYDEFYYRVPCSVECSPFGKCDDRVGICICNDVAIGTDCKTLNLQLDSVISTLITGGQVYLNGDFSNVKDQSLTIKIGNQECSNVKFNDNNFKVLECTIGAGEGIKDIIISSGLLSFTKANSFEYQYYKCPLDCSTPNGTCDSNTGICTCDNEHIGNGCEIRFIECKDKCSTKHGICDNDNGNCKCDTQTKGLTCEESRLLIESSDSINSKGGTIHIIGYFGNPTSLLTIKIGESQCKNIKVFNETTLKCDIGEGKGIHNITIIDDDLSFTAINKFQYLDEKTKNSGISGGAIAAIVVGCVVAILLIGSFLENTVTTTLYYFYRLIIIDIDLGYGNYIFLKYYFKQQP